ncbi:GDSL-type esterase/lipase family protein [Georgenia sp. MJ173]|uniref:GDSL-type esterase/lipase family protein n=1 Tax=Georgenia sunbinii TaxID=3117728 RepID=UPI002F26C8E2
MTDISLHPSARGWAWHGVAEWQADDGVTRPWRISQALTSTAHNEHFSHRVRTPAGVRAEVVTDATSLTVAGALGPGTGETRPGVIDVVVDGVLHSRLTVPQPGPGALAEVADVVALPAGPKRLEAWLPHTEVFGLREITLRGVTTAEAPPARPRWLSYGSSITHCAEACGPTETWPALVARSLGLDLYGLGLGGQCHLDHAVERTIADQPLDFLSLCLGINIYGRGSFDERSLGSALHGFLDRTLRAHPGIPVLVMSPICAPLLEDTLNRADLTLGAVRDTVRRVAAAIDDPRLTYLDGREVLGANDAAQHLGSDQLHPTADGYRLMAERLAPRLAAAFGLRPTADDPAGSRR